MLSDLRKIGCITESAEQEFLLKSGQRSNLYIDLRRLIAYPTLLGNIAKALTDKSARILKGIDFVAGIPLGGIPLATYVSSQWAIPMIMIRPERKKHGTGKLIEGLTPQQETTKNTLRVVLIEDVINTGGSVLETIEKIKESGVNMEVVGCMCIVNRGNATHLGEKQIPIYSLWSLKDIKNISSITALTERSLLTRNLFTRNLFQRMTAIKSNVIWSADITNGKRMLEVLDAIAPYIVAVKVHFDIFEANTFDAEVFKRICTKHSLPIISDRKYADIEATVSLQISNGLHERIASAATVHPFAGSGSINALSRASISAILVAEMSNATRQFNDAAAVAEPSPGNVAGFVCQSRNTCDAGDGFIYMTPGIHISLTGDGRDQKYRSCETAIREQHNDVVIVGRGISESHDPTQTVKEYQKLAWEALCGEEQK